MKVGKSLSASYQNIIQNKNKNIFLIVLYFNLI